MGYVLWVMGYMKLPFASLCEQNCGEPINRSTEQPITLQQDVTNT